MNENAANLKTEIEALIRQSNELAQLIVQRKKDYTFAVQTVKRVRAKDVKEGDEILVRTNGNERYTERVAKVYTKKNGMILFIRAPRCFTMEEPKISDSSSHILYGAKEPMQWIEIVEEPDFEEDEFLHEVAKNLYDYD